MRQCAQSSFGFQGCLAIIIKLMQGLWRGGSCEAQQLSTSSDKQQVSRKFPGLCRHWVPVCGRGSTRWFQAARHSGISPPPCLRTTQPCEERDPGSPPTLSWLQGMAVHFHASIPGLALLLQTPPWALTNQTDICSLPQWALWTCRFSICELLGLLIFTSLDVLKLVLIFW